MCIRDRYYPLSLNALVNACNQKSNREPVVSYDEDIVETALAGLRDKGLAARISGHDMRVPKHAHRLSEVINLGPVSYTHLLEIAEGIDPYNFEYHVALAHVYARSGRNEEARRERKISIQLARESDPRGPS